MLWFLGVHCSGAVLGGSGVVQEVGGMALAFRVRFVLFFWGGLGFRVSCWGLLVWFLGLGFFALRVRRLTPGLRRRFSWS